MACRQPPVRGTRPMSAFLEREGCETVGFEKSMWRVVIDDHRILLGAHIDDFVIACANLPVLDAFRKRLLEAFEGTHMKAPSNTTLDVKLPVTPSPAPLLSLKSITPKRFCDRVDFGIFHRATHLWNQTLAF